MSSYNPQEGMSGRPPKKSNTTKIVLIVLGVFGLLGLLCCGGFAGLMWVGTNQINEMETQDLKRRLSESPVAATELGTIESLNLNLFRSAEETQKSNSGGGQQKQIRVFDVGASKASGQIVCEATAPLGQEGDIISGKLVKADGTEVELFGDEMSIDLGSEVGTESPTP